VNNDHIYLFGGEAATAGSLAGNIDIGTAIFTLGDEHLKWPSSVAMQTPRNYPTSFALGDQLCFHGGETAGPSPVALSDAQCATVDGNGFVGTPFVNQQPASQGTYSRHSSAVIGNYVYLIGSTSGPNFEVSNFASVSQLNFHDSGKSLSTPRWSGGSFVSGDLMHLIGGQDGSASGVASDQGITFTDGQLGISSGNLDASWKPRFLFSMAYTGVDTTSASPAQMAVAIGGRFVGGSAATVTHAFSTDEWGRVTADADGLFNGAIVDATVVVLQGVLFELGDNSRKMATIDNMGALNFSTYPLSLAVPYRAGACTFLNGSGLFMVGGSDNNGPNAATQRAPMTSGSTFSAFVSSVGNLPMSDARYAHRCIALGNRVFIIGGVVTTGAIPTPSMASSNILMADIDPVNADFTAPFASGGGSIVSPRRNFSVAVIGNHAYLFGGTSAAAGNVSGSGVNTIEVADLQ
jgi:hypothetical protein